MKEKIQIKDSILELQEEWPQEIVDRFHQEYTPGEINAMGLQDFLIAINGVEKDLHSEDQELDRLINE
jgi:hypothetical protein